MIKIIINKIKEIDLVNLNKKEIILSFENPIRQNINDGNIFYGITINISDETETNNKINKIINYCSDEVEFWSFNYLVLEFNKKNKPHLHMLLAIRSVLGYNDSIEIFLKEVFTNNIEKDTILKELKREKDIKNFIAYLIKDVEKSLEYHYLSCNKANENYFEEFIKISNKEKLNLNLIVKEKNDEYIFGVKKTEEKHTTNTIMHIWNCFITLNQFYYYSGDFFKKKKNSIISFEKQFKKEFLIENFDEIINYLIQNIPMQFKYLNYQYLKNQFLVNMDNKIEKISMTINNKIKPKYDIIEFIDGIYFIKFDKFIKKEKLKNIENLDKKIATTKYYNCTYHNLKKPEVWIKNIEKALKNKNEDINTIACYLANIFHKNKNIFQKKKVLYIYGQSNTKKTTLIAKPLINFFELKNIGFITNNLNFNFQNIIDKKVAILDEFKYSKNNKEQLLKLFAWEPALIDIKFKNAELIEEIPIIIISNELIKEDNKEIQEAFNNRIQKITFYKENNRNIEIDYLDDINESIKKEEVNIIVYCNKIFFKIIRKYAKERKNNKNWLVKNYLTNVVKKIESK